MTKDLAKAALIFLQRADLKGGEAPAWMAVARALEDVLNEPEVATEGEPSGDPQS